jgi:hypothetical protein
MSVRAPESRHRSANAADRDVIAYYGRAKLTDKHLASKIHCVARLRGGRVLARKAEETRAFGFSRAQFKERKIVEVNDVLHVL